MILGVDPALTLTGYAVVNDMNIVSLGSIKTTSKLAMPERLAHIFSSVTDLLEQYQPGRVVIEDQFAGRNIKTLKVINQVTGVILLACGLQDGISFRLYPPAQIKKAVAGHGRASKEDVAAAVVSQYQQDAVLKRYLQKTSGKTDDVTDALACVLMDRQHEEKTGST